MRARACLLLWRPLWMLCKLKKEKKKETNERHRKQAHSSFLFFFLYFITPSSPSHSLSLILIISQELGKKESAPQTRCWFRSLGRSQKGKKEHKQQGRDTSSLSRALFPTLSTLFVFSLSLALSVTRISWPRPLSNPPPLCAQRERQHKGKGEERRHTGGGKNRRCRRSLSSFGRRKKGRVFLFFSSCFCWKNSARGKKTTLESSKGFFLSLMGEGEGII